MRAITLIYVLRDGRRGTLPCIARCTADAIGLALDHFGDQLACCSARPGHRGGA